MNLSDHFRSLAADMAEAQRRAGNNHDSSCWEELENILAQYEKCLNAPTPPRRTIQAPLPPPANTYDLEHARAVRCQKLP
ncbi:MAG: hypothetical protein LW834_06790 [Cyanobium sp. 49614_E6]|jgi:hypothetical protein|nr:hypothetical protein [Cyanobium sp. 49614_E6]MCE2836652.1 hypothetical protein [Cyanobium sp. 49614_E6]